MGPEFMQRCNAKVVQLHVHAADIALSLAIYQRSLAL